MGVYNEKEGFNFWKAVMWTAVSLAIIVGLWVGITSMVWGLRVATAGLYGRGEARIQIQSAPFRIQAYQSFFDQCASIQGLEGKISELEEQLAQTERGTREYNYTLSSLTGAKGLRLEAIAKYNQDALKNYTEGQFRDQDLPHQIKGEKTVCAVR